MSLSSYPSLGQAGTNGAQPGKGELSGGTRGSGVRLQCQRYKGEDQPGAPLRQPGRHIGCLGLTAAADALTHACATCAASRAGRAVPLGTRTAPPCAVMDSCCAPGWPGAQSAAPRRDFTPGLAARWLACPQGRPAGGLDAFAAFCLQRVCDL